MRKIFLSMVIGIILFASVCSARQVPIGFNWLYEPSKMPVGWTVDQVIGITDKIIIYQSFDAGITWTKIGEFPMSSFPLPLPVAGWPVIVNIELADGNIYSFHIAVTTVNKNTEESIKSNWLPFSFDLRPMPKVPPTITK